MSDLTEEYTSRAVEAEINVVWSCDPDLQFYWREAAAAYRRLAAATIARRAIVAVVRSDAA
jgi:hypothetical protein